MEDYAFCVLTEFDQVYATSSNFSWTNAVQFKKFCNAAGIRCDEINAEKYFNEGMCDGAFLTREYTYDAQMLKEHFLKEIKKYSKIEMKFSARIETIIQKSDCFEIKTGDNEIYQTEYLLNASYASTNQIIKKLGYEPFSIKYELCEIILCRVSDSLKHVGLTVMDGPFFSIMPFGKTGYHSLTSVTFTPHVTSYESVPVFDCQQKSGGCCSENQLGNCNDCPAKPASAWPYMSNMAKKYMREEYRFEYSHSLFSMKPILKASEIDDSRPTVIKQFSNSPTFISVLSGKINTVYDLDEVLRN
jgi:hypothetical protein